jgi:hypothetical protein
VAGQRCVSFSEKDIGQRRALTVFEDLFSDLGQLDVGVLGVRGEGLLQLPVLRPQPFQLFHQLIGRRRCGLRTGMDG